MSQVVEYVMTLKDLLTQKIQQAETRAKSFEHQLHEAGNAAEGIGTKMSSGLKMLGIGFAAFEGFNFIHEGIEKAEELHQAEVQLTNSMQNMGTYSKEAFEEIEKSAGKFADTVRFSKADVIGLQSLLVMTGVKGEESLQRMTTASADMAAKFGGDMKEWGNVLAKSITDPMMARRLEQKVFISPEAKKHIADLAKAGKETEAQMSLLAAVEDKVADSATSAFNADPLARYNKAMGKLKLAAGEAGMEILSELQPALMKVIAGVKSFVGWIKDSVHWMKEHKDLMTAAGVAIGIIATYYAIITTATTLWTAAQWLLNAALSANPISIAVIALAALAAGLVYAYEKVSWFKAGLWAAVAIVKEFGAIVSDVFSGIGQIWTSIWKGDLSGIKDGTMKAIGAIANASQRIGNAAAQGYAEGMADFTKSQQTVGAAGSTIKNKNVKPDKSEVVKDIAAKGATGQKITTINIRIDKMIEKFNISTTNLQDATSKIQEKVAEALLGAVRDSQLKAGI